jgi:hypothetical protein
MNEKSLQLYWIITLLTALVVNENLVQWMLAMIIGGYGLLDGFKDAYKYFTIEGYLFFTTFRLFPYVTLGLAVKVL